VSLLGGPDDETPQDLRRRLADELMRQLDAGLERAYREGELKKPTEFVADHFTWTVRFQIREEDVADIAGDASVDPRTVNVAISHVLELLRLDRRSTRPGPKPKSSRNQK
jgi:hypothetical protein